MLKTLLLTAVLTLLLCGLAGAQTLERSYVSTNVAGGTVTYVGNDANPCTREEPCRSLQRALTQTLRGGEIVVMNSGEYGGFFIDKSVSIIAAENHGGIYVSAGNAIRVAALSTDEVIIRGLVIKSAGRSGNGIQVESGNVYVEDCLIANFGGAGLKRTGGTLRVSRSAIIFNNAGVEGDVWSLGDNRLVGNVTANEFPPRPSDNRLQ
ncbi:MAG: hypothetical protein ACR2GW_07075 [Pyrinomonadaceae bacterium]